MISKEDIEEISTAMGEKGEIVARVDALNRNAKEWMNDRTMYRELWEAAASCLVANNKKIKARGPDESRMLDWALGSMHGHFWSGQTNGWIPTKGEGAGSETKHCDNAEIESVRKIFNGAVINNRDGIMALYDAGMLRPKNSATDSAQLIKALNQLRNETDVGVVADVILSIGFRLEQ